MGVEKYFRGHEIIFLPDNKAVPIGSMHLVKLWKPSPNNYKNGLCSHKKMSHAHLNDKEWEQVCSFLRYTLEVAKKCSAISISLYLSISFILLLSGQDLPHNDSPNPGTFI